MICPRCAAAEISPVTGKCELCGYQHAGGAPHPADDVVGLAKGQLAHEFVFGEDFDSDADSAVVRAKEVATGRPVLVRVTQRRAADPEAAESFRTTMAAFQQLDHPNLLSVLRFGSTDSVFWYATDDRGGTTLRARLRTEERVDLRASRRILTQLASALDYLHRRGLVHGAVRAESVLVDANGWVGLTDPNTLRPTWRRVAKPTPAAGMPKPAPAKGAPPRPSPAEGTAAPAGDQAAVREPWVAPEEFSRGERFPAADQYALAALAFEMLAGRALTGAPRALAELRPDLPVRCVRAVERALSASPAQRFPSCADFLFALEEETAIANTGPAARVTSEVVMVKDWKAPSDPHRKAKLAGRIAVGVALAAGLVFAAPTVKSALSPRPPVQSEETTSGAPSAARATPTDGARPDPTSTVVLTTPRSDVPRSTPRTSNPVANAPAEPREPAPAAPAATARLFVNSTPWGQVFVDGQGVGNTPRPNLPITAGTHTLRVQREGFTAWERTIRIAAGDTLRFTDIVLAPINP